MTFTTNKNGNLCLTFNSNLCIDTSFTRENLGNEESEMELFTNDNGTPSMIEWVCYDQDIVEHIGLWFDGKTLEDYDGVFELPKEAIKLIRKSGYTVPRHFED